MILSGALQQLRSPFTLTPRLLQQTAAPTTVPFLPADPGGELFMPPCSFDIPCNYDLVSPSCLCQCHFVNAHTMLLHLCCSGLN